MDIFKLFGIGIQKLIVDGRDYTTKQLRRRAAMASASKPKAKWEQAAKESHQEDRAAKREELGERASAFESRRTPRQVRQLELPMRDEPQTGTLPSGRGLPSRRRNLPMSSRQNLPDDETDWVSAINTRNIPSEAEGRRSMASRSNLPMSSRSNLPAASPPAEKLLRVNPDTGEITPEDYAEWKREQVRNVPAASPSKKDYPTKSPTEKPSKMSRSLMDSKKKQATADEKNLPIVEETYPTKEKPQVDWAKWKRDSDKEMAAASTKAAVPRPQASDLGPGPREVSNVDVPLDEGGMPQPYDIESDVRGEWGDYPTRPPYTTDYDTTTGAHYPGKPDPRGEKADIRATKKHGGIAPPSVMDKALFKIFGMKKAHDDIPEFLPHPEIPDIMIRNPEYIKLKHSGLTPPGDAPLGEGTTTQEMTAGKILPDTFAPEKKLKQPHRVG